MIYVQIKNNGHDKNNTFYNNASLLFDSIESADARPEQKIISGFEGALLRSSCTFPYFMLIALEAGNPIRAFLLLLFYPIAFFLTHILHLHQADLRLYTFIAFAGLPTSAVHCVCRAVLPKAYLDDAHHKVYKLFTTCNRRFLLTSLPRVMVESFAKDHLGTEQVLGSELHVTRGGRYTGLLSSTQGGLLSGHQRYSAVRNLFFGGTYPDIGIGSDAQPDAEFLELCKKSYIVESGKVVPPMPKTHLLKPLIFHDGRLVHRPTPMWALTICLWIPIALPLALIRIVVGISLPKRIAMPIEHLLGVSVRCRGNLPPPTSSSSSSSDGSQGVLFVLSHRTLLDPVFISFAMGQEVAAVTYSLSRLSEILSPIRTVRLTRSKEEDASTMDRMLKQGHLAVCPEGTTCREPYLLRFSSLFAELTDRIVPVSLSCSMPVFHGTSARGWKCLDGLFFFMNPVVSYELGFLGQLEVGRTCRGGGLSGHDVANYVQRLVADSLGFHCTALTRRDKYRILAGNDGIVRDPATQHSNSSSFMN